MGIWRTTSTRPIIEKAVTGKHIGPISWRSNSAVSSHLGLRCEMASNIACYVKLTRARHISIQKGIPSEWRIISRAHHPVDLSQSHQLSRLAGRSRPYRRIGVTNVSSSGNLSMAPIIVNFAGITPMTTTSPVRNIKSANNTRKPTSERYHHNSTARSRRSMQGFLRRLRLRKS